MEEWKNRIKVFWVNFFVFIFYIISVMELTDYSVWEGESEAWKYR